MILKCGLRVKLEFGNSQLHRPSKEFFKCPLHNECSDYIISLLSYPTWAKNIQPKDAEKEPNCLLQFRELQLCEVVFEFLAVYGVITIWCSYYTNHIVNFEQGLWGEQPYLKDHNVVCLFRDHFVSSWRVLRRKNGMLATSLLLSGSINVLVNSLLMHQYKEC